MYTKTNVKAQSIWYDIEDIRKSQSNSNTLKQIQSANGKYFSSPGYKSIHNW